MGRVSDGSIALSNLFPYTRVRGPYLRYGSGVQLTLGARMDELTSSARTPSGF